MGWLAEGASLGGRSVGGRRMHSTGLFLGGARPEAPARL